MSKLQTTRRRYANKMRYKYRQDPFAFIVLWALFFSAIFLIFAFRGLLAVSFMKKIDISQTQNNTASNIVNSIIEENNNTVDQPTNSEIPSSGETYIVKDGDTLYMIGLELKQDWQKIAELNGITPPYDLKVGQVLKLP